MLRRRVLNGAASAVATSAASVRTGVSTSRIVRGLQLSVRSFLRPSKPSKVELWPEDLGAIKSAKIKERDVTTYAKDMADRLNELKTYKETHSDRMVKLYTYMFVNFKSHDDLVGMSIIRTNLLAAKTMSEAEACVFSAKKYQDKYQPTATAPDDEHIERCHPSNR